MASIGKRWSDVEERKLLEDIQKKVPIEEIAKEFGRTVRGIHSHQGEMAFRYVTYQNKSVDEAAKLTGLQVYKVHKVLGKQTMKPKVDLDELLLIVRGLEAKMALILENVVVKFPGTIPDDFR